MNRIKDFIYDKNDLLVALLIVLLAAFVIVVRVDVIMAYPSTLEAEMDNAAGDRVGQQEETKNDLVSSTVEENGGSDDSIDTEDADDSDDFDETLDAQGSGSPNTPIKPEDQPPHSQGETNTGEGAVSVYINYGSTAGQIAQLLIDAGLINSKDSFFDVLSSTGADTRLQAGSFSIPANSSLEEIVRIITQ